MAAVLPLKYTFPEGKIMASHKSRALLYGADRKYVYLLMWAQPFKEQQPEIKGSVLLRSVSKMGKMETRIVEKQGEIDGR